MVKRILCRIIAGRRVQTRHPERESGQSLIILAFALLGLIAMLGLALDLGLVYIERVRLKRAVDAATLAGVVELPYEDQSFQRALEYLELNGYDTANSNIYISGCVRDINGDPTALVNATNYPYNLAADPRAPSFYLDTWAYQSDHDLACPTPDDIGNANKLEITGTISVNMNFMQFFGFKYVDVSDSAVAQNVDNLDVVVVFDRSGSMGYDPVCLGCWTRDPGLTQTDIPEYYEYPSNGYFHPIPTTQISEYCFLNPDTGGLGTGGYPPKTFVDNNLHYTIIEAELYSYNNSQPATEFRSQGKGYWALQRDGQGSLGLDGRGGYMAHHPEQTFYPGTNPYGRFYTLTDAQNGNAPLLEYRFWLDLDETPDDWGSYAYVWVRARRSACPFDRCTDQYGNVNRSTFYWSLDDTTTSGVDFPTRALTADQYSDLDANPDEWRWIRLDKFPISTGQPPEDLSGPYKLQLWAGSSGIRMDRIIITNDSSSPLPSAARDHALTPGSAWGEACDPCNPIYGLTVEPGDCLGYSPVVSGTTDLRTNALWGDGDQPLRGSKEAIKRFAMRLDPKRDQVGLVTYSTDSTQASQLECISRWGSACYEGTTPISYTRVLAAIESVSSNGMTCTGCAMRDGLKVLGINIDNQNNFNNDCDGGSNSHCARGGAKKVMILITDGVPNEYPKNTVCDNQDYYPGEDAPYDCMIYYARQGRLKGVTIFTIGLGFGVDANLLEAVADEGAGFYRPAYSTSNLDDIFDEILSNIYVRLIR